MENYVISKSDKIFKLKKKAVFANGYSFRGKLNITMYEINLIKDILVKKINTSFKNIMIALVNLDDDDEDSSKVSELEIRIETLRVLLLEKYFPFIGKTRAGAYLTRLEEIEKKIPRKENKKSRVR